MGLIIGNKIPMFIKGYPTVSDKYNVAGAVLAGSNAVRFGDLVIKDTQTPNGNYFKKITTTFTTDDLGGFVVSTNVKLANDFPGTVVQVNPGEAFNLLVNGFIAVELEGEDVNTDDIVANKAVAVFLSGKNVGKLSTKGAQSTDDTPVTATDLPNVVFTGLYENRGTSAAPKYYAEIYVK